MERLFNGQLEVDQCRSKGNKLCVFGLKRKPQWRTVVSVGCSRLSTFQFLFSVSKNILRCSGNDPVVPEVSPSRGTNIESGTNLPSHHFM